MKRAYEHAEDVKRLLGEFDGPPTMYGVVAEDEGHTGDLVYRATVDPRSERLLNDLALVAGDAFHNLRSALDFLAWQVVEANGGKPGRRTSFPIADSWQEFNSRGANYISGASEQAVKLLNQVRPYRGGNNALWRLHRLDVADKHRLLLGVDAAYTEAFGFWRAGDGREFRMRLAPSARLRPYPVVEDTELYRIPFQYRDSAEKHSEPEFTFEVAVTDGDAIPRAPLLRTLDESIRAVESMLSLFLPLIV